MVTENALVESRGGLVGIPDPQGVIDQAIRAAKVLTAVLAQKKHPVMMNGEQYLEYEDWQTLGQFYAVTAITGEAVAVEIDGVKGAKATAKVVNLHTGEIIGGAEAYCMRDEPKWNTRPKYDYTDDGKKNRVGDEPVPWFQLASMAQTRAGAKALRNRLAWVAVLGGYKPTPAEELTGNEVSTREAAARDDTNSKYYCKEHQTTWFMRGNMTGYAHPIEGTKKWCSMPSVKPVEAKQPEPPTTEPKGQPEASQKLTMPSDAATEAQWATLIRLGRELGGFRDDAHITTTILARLDKKEKAECNGLEIGQIVSEWSNVLAERKKGK